MSGPVDERVAVFMDSANDDELENIIDIYESESIDHSFREKLLTYTNKKKSTALHLAANNGNADVVEYLVDKINQDFPEERKRWVNMQNAYYFTPLMSVCFRGYLTKGQAKDCGDDRLAIVKKLVENGANVAYFTQDTKMTCMHWAAYNLDSGVTKYLLE